MSKNISVKASDKGAGKGIIRIQKIVDELNIPVLCYGLRVDFRGELFAGSLTLLSIADEMREI